MVTCQLFIRNVATAIIIVSSFLVNAQGSNSLESPALNPWITPLKFCNQNPGKYSVDINMGFLNTDYLCTITEKDGVRFDTKKVELIHNDAARLVLSMANQCNQLDSIRILVGASRDSENELRKLLPNASKNSIIQIQKNSLLKSPDENHAKVFQLSNGIDQFFTVHGSVNLQTVGLTCKANNALRFVEKTPALYQYFNQRIGKYGLSISTQLSPRCKSLCLEKNCLQCSFHQTDHGLF